MTDTNELHHTAAALVARGKGILAADESNGTMGKRLASIGLENEEEYRRAWRELLFTTQDIGAHIGGVILYEETVGQETKNGTPFMEVLKNAGVIPGIKVDGGLAPYAEQENCTNGIENLSERCKHFYTKGARFAKWRALLHIGNGRPTDGAIEKNAQQLADYAFVCQQNGLMPIVEPEILMEGNHTIEACYDATNRTLQGVYSALGKKGVDLKGTLLKPSMVLAGSTCPTQADCTTVAKETLRCLKETVPTEVPGLVFLSGGQSDVDATAHLDAMNKMGLQSGQGGQHGQSEQTQGRAPWTLSFSYGRALQAPALKTWAGKPENASAAQAVFAHRAQCNGLAAMGQYASEMEQKAPVAA